MNIDCQYNNQNHVTALVSNKKKEIRIGKKLKDRTQYPLYLVLPEYNAKMHMMLSSKNDMF